jgi:hypothetical protein
LEKYTRLMPGIFSISASAKRAATGLPRVPAE